MRYQATTCTGQFASDSLTAVAKWLRENYGAYPSVEDRHAGVTHHIANDIDNAEFTESYLCSQLDAE